MGDFSQTTIAATVNISPNDIAATGAGTTTAGVYQLSVANAGNAVGTWAGMSLPIGASITHTGYYDPSTRQVKRIGSVAYDATGTTFIISETP